MSTVWSEGYFTDIGYTYNYYRELAPAFHKFCLLLQGMAVAEVDEPSHCELGFGQGVSLNINAAANPGRFFGNDFAPAQTSYAQALATAAGTELQLTDASFEQYLAADLPQFDSISLHGIWSWVSADNRALLLQFARRRLKPGGILYMSYNAYPGWSATAPLRQIFAMHDRFVAAPGAATTRVKNATRFAADLLAVNPFYGRNVRGLQEHARSVLDKDPAYLAHEYFNREWACMYFSDVAGMLETAKLDYVGTATLLDRVDAIQLRAEAQQFLAGIDQPILREQARDYFVNQQFRRDLYMRGPVPLQPGERRARLLATQFVLAQPPDEIPLKIQGAAGEASLMPELYGPVLELLARDRYSPKSLQELGAVVPAKDRFKAIVQIITILIGRGSLYACQPEEHVRVVGRRCRKLNEQLLQMAEHSTEISALASPLFGMGVPVDRQTQLFLLAALRKQEDAAAFAWSCLKAENDPLSARAGSLLQVDEANVAELRLRHERFKQHTLPLLRAAGIA